MRWHPTGGVHERSRYRAGELHGLQEFSDPAGRRLLEVRWEGGRREGIAREWWPDGSPRSEGAFRDDERHGPWTFRTAAGELDGRRSGLYEDGERVAPLSPD